MRADSTGAADWTSHGGRILACLNVGHALHLSARRRIMASGFAVGVLLMATAVDPGHQASASAPAPDAPIEFEPVGEAPLDVAPIVEESQAGAVRSRFAAVDSDALLEGLSADDVEIELFDDVVVDFGGSGELSSGDDGRPTWSATTDDAVATLSFGDDGVRGSIADGGTVYSLVPASATTHLIFEGGRDLPDESEPIAPPVVSDSDASAPVPTAPLDRTPSAASDEFTPVVRVLTVYDDFSRSYFGDDAAAVASLSATIDEVNAAYARSGVDLMMESAAIEHVAYSGSIDANEELDRISGRTDGHLDAVHARRDAVGADLVVFVTQLDINVTCGIAWLLSAPISPSDAAFGFSVVEPRCARGNLTFAHETAHNLGAGHGNGDGNGASIFANGYRNAAGGYRTIMSYNANGCCTRVAHFSNPDVSYHGSTDRNGDAEQRMPPEPDGPAGGPVPRWSEWARHQPGLRDQFVGAGAVVRFAAGRVDGGWRVGGCRSSSGSHGNGDSGVGPGWGAVGGGVGGVERGGSVSWRGRIHHGVSVWAGTAVGVESELRGRCGGAQCGGGQSGRRW